MTLVWPLLALASLLAEPAPQVLTPREDTDVVLHNPDMGWVLYENYPLDPRRDGTATLSVLPDARFDGCDAVAVMAAWSDLEVAEGVFDWQRFDHACDYWLARGKRLHLRLSTEPLFGWSRLGPPSGLGVPSWLLDRLPAELKQRREDGAQFGWHVDARHPLYLQRLKAFLAAVNTHCQGARSPDLVDLRGFGRWGEWHTGYRYASLADKREALGGVLRAWSESFPDRPLALSYSFDPDGPPELYAGPTDRYDEAATRSYDDYVRHSAFDLALALPNVTLRRDGAGGAVHSNERRLCEHAYLDLRRAPMMSEFLGGYASTRAGGPTWLRHVVDDALSLHPNYIGLLGYGGRDAQAFMAERPDLVAHGLRRMGYRLTPLRAEVRTPLRLGQPVTLALRWTNRGVGRALRDYRLRLRLLDTKTRRPLAQAEAGPLPTSRWLLDEVADVVVEATFTGAAPDKAILALSLQDPASRRAIQLPLVRRSADEFGELGEVTITP